MRARQRLVARLLAPSDRVALRLGDRALTWAAWGDAACRYAAALRASGIAPGDRIAVMASTGIELAIALAGHHLLGVVHVPINTRYEAAEVDHILRDSGARWLLMDGQGPLRDRVAGFALPPTIERVVGLGAQPWDLLLEHPPDTVPGPTSDEATALLIYTSGTTGRSKGVALPFRAVAGAIGALTTLWAWSEDDRLVLALPLFHVHGLCIGLHGTLLHGNETVLLPTFDADAVIDALADGGTVFMGVPTMYTRLVAALDAAPDRARPLRRVRLFTSGSAALSPDLFDRFEAHTGHRILERYGMSETLLTLSNPYAGERRRGTVGLPVPGFEVRICSDDGVPCAPGEVGELEVRGVGVMSAYHALPDATAASFRAGWFRTGDVATASDDGYVTLLGRRSVDILKCGGFKISAREIEEALEGLDGLAEVAVYGVPDAEWGQRIAAAVVPVTLGERSDADWLAAVQARCRATLADFKCVREVVVLPALPRNALGKVQKHRLAGRSGTE
jgi:acyl-CoA synthetase (AMP-forming)/AMP-acid ligase II